MGEAETKEERQNGGGHRHAYDRRRMSRHLPEPPMSIDSVGALRRWCDVEMMLRFSKP
ncbi:hypothetical protein Syun_018920 [Stephania yunnanensis]|uniref:Uncharacterized protein n=1 Tax=Stephania yunnanensis TaxID=152371 RepID=A0AAP0IT53_9MAGN